LEHRSGAGAGVLGQQEAARNAAVAATIRILTNFMVFSVVWLFFIRALQRKMTGKD
jgi:hypothetical protein